MTKYETLLSEYEEKLLTLASVYSPLSDDYKPSLENYNGLAIDFQKLAVYASWQKKSGTMKQV